MADASEDNLESFTPEKKKKVGHYVLGRKIGEGTFTKVRLGTHTIAKEKVAVKVVPKRVLVQRESARRNFRREAVLLQHLDHPNIVRLYEAMETPNSYYLVLELVDGGLFIQYLAERKSLDETEARGFARQLVSAVDHMHRSGIIHRDLKLENFLLDTVKNIKIIDFGLGNTLQKGRSLTTQCGSPAYAAPEMFNNRQYGATVDIWSLGVCLYAMLLGRLPFLPEATSNLTQLHALILQGCVIPNFLSKDCQDILSRLLEPMESRRIKLDRVFSHDWMTEGYDQPITKYCPVSKVSQHSVNTDIVKYMTNVFSFDESDVLCSLGERKVNAARATYRLLLQRIQAGYKLSSFQSERYRSESTCTHATALSGDDSAVRLPVLNGLAFSESVDSNDGMFHKRIGSYKSCVMCLREHHSNAPEKQTRPKSLDSSNILPGKQKTLSIFKPSKDKLPALTFGQMNQQDRSEHQRGGTGRHRETWDDSEHILDLNVQGKSAYRSEQILSNYDVLPTAEMLAPPAPPNTAYGFRVAKKRTNSSEDDVDKASGSTFESLSDPYSVVSWDSVERQKTKILGGIDFPKRKLCTYNQPLSIPKLLTARQERSASMALLRKFSDSKVPNSMSLSNVTRNNFPCATATTESARTSVSAESVEKDDALTPIIKVTITTCKQ